MNFSDKTPMSLQAKVIVVVTFEFLVMTSALFLSAGIVAWSAAWVFLCLLFVCGPPVTWLLKYDPGLIEERMRFRTQLSRDRVFVAIMLVLR